MERIGFLSLTEDNPLAWVIAIIVNTIVFAIFAFGTHAGWILAQRWLG